jgi:hypothetical protein
MGGKYFAFSPLKRGKKLDNLKGNDILSNG